jgi:4-alpha-glucanotransferase
VQDVLGLGSEARMNRPGQVGGNWSWRLGREQLTPEHALRLRAATAQGRR